MQKKCISAVLWQNKINHASNIYRNVFNSFYRIVTHGESHGIIYKEIFLSMVTPSFELPDKNSPQTGTCHFNGPPLSAPFPETIPKDTWTQSTTRKLQILWTPQARFLIACSNFKSQSHKIFTLGQAEPLICLVERAKRVWETNS